MGETSKTDILPEKEDRKAKLEEKYANYTESQFKLELSKLEKKSEKLSKKLPDTRGKRKKEISDQCREIVEQIDYIKKKLEIVKPGSFDYRKVIVPNKSTTDMYVFLDLENAELKKEYLEEETTTVLTTTEKEFFEKDISIISDNMVESMSEYEKIRATFSLLYMRDTFKNSLSSPDTDRRLRSILKKKLAIIEGNISKLGIAL